MEKKFKPVYLLIGPDHREIKKKVRDLELAFFPQTNGEDINNISFFSEESDSLAIFSECQTFPVFTDKKLVKVHDAEKIEKKALLEYLQKPVHSTTLLLLSTKNEKDFNKDIIDLIHKNGKVISFGEKYDNEAIQYLGVKLKKANIPFEQDFLSHVIEQVENTTGALDKVFEAVESYYDGEKPIRVVDIPDLLSSSKVPSSFQFIDALFSKNQVKALRIIHQIILEDFNPGSMISLIFRQLKLLFQCKVLLNSGASQQLIAKELKLAPFLVKKVSQQAKLFELNELEKMIDSLSQLDFKCKSSEASLIPTYFELFVLGY